MRATWEQVHECADLAGQPGQLGAQSVHSGHAGLALGDTGPRASVFLAGSSGLLLKGDPGVGRFSPSLPGHLGGSGQRAGKTPGFLVGRKSFKAGLCGFSHLGALGCFTFYFVYF